MSPLKSVIERKFGEAQRLYLGGKEPIRVENGILGGLRYEIIGLDCESGGTGCFRYLVSRCSLDTKSIGFARGVLDNLNDFDLTNILVRAPRQRGDHRRLEDVPHLSGDVLMVDAERNAVIEATVGQPNRWSDFAIQSLARQLDALRVAEQLPNFAL